MQRTLQDHIDVLERKVANLRVLQYDIGCTAGERHQAALDLELSEKALALFLKAFALEQRISKTK